MISDSILAMSIIDGLVIAGVGLVFLVIARGRGKAATDSVVSGAGLILAGLGCIALFHVADLVAMHLLPRIVGNAEAMAAMDRLHLEARWYVTLLALGLICWGLVLGTSRRRTAEAALAASEARYRSMIGDMSDFIVRWQPGGMRTWVNEPYCEFFGKPREELIGTSILEQIADSDRERIRAELASLTPETPSRTGVHEVLRPDGSPGWQEWTDRALFDDAGELIEIQSVGRDITDRILSAGELSESEARFRGFVENTSDWVWEIDSSGRHVYTNSRVENLLGFSPEELYALDIGQIVHPDDLKMINARIPLFIREKRGWYRWIIRFFHKDGSQRYLESTAAPILDDQGAVTGFRGTDRNATLPTLLLKISSDLVGRPAEEIDRRIRQALEQIGRCYALERISLWWLDGPYFRRSHEWALEGLSGGTTEVRVESTIPEFYGALRQGRVVRVESLDQLRSGLPDAQFLRAQGVRSTLQIPLFSEDDLVGIAVFSTITHERKWPEMIESELRLISEKIVAAYVGAEATKTILRRERDLAHSESLARVGSFAYYPYSDSARFPEEWKLEMSRECASLLEWEQDSANFELFLARVHPDDRALLEEGSKRLLATGKDVDVQFRVVNPSGAELHFASRTQIERDASGRNIRIIGAFRDITEQVSREKSLKRALAEIESLRDRLEAENVQLREEVRAINEFRQIIGDSRALGYCLDLAAKAAPTDAAVLILGETGTGKELLAKAIHDLSLRREQRLVSLNCTALPAELVESELFGHEKGAFTGAHKRREGRFQLADGGTLFLDEIGDLPMPLQGKLLRVLQDGSFERLGGTETLYTDVRLIAATNKNLEAAVQRGEFRADLYYRINTVPIELPALRERKEDIPQLAHHFARKHASRLGKSIESISSGLLKQLQEKEWPGNVRELEHYIERCLISSQGSVLSQDERELRSTPGREAAQDESGSDNGDLRSVEREHILRVLSEVSWIIGGRNGAAARLGLPPSTLRSKMKRLGIERRQ